MKASLFKYLLSSLFFLTFFSSAFAQDDDGIYGDIYQAPEIEEELIDTASPLDGYSTVDEYYSESGYQESQESYSEEYSDENGDTYITNNYYDDDYDSDFSYSARINRFHRPVGNYGYYDSYYTNLYWYTYDPYYWGSSIYVGYWPTYYSSWNTGWNFGWGWNRPTYYPACYGGYNYGWNGYGNGYNHGYWNGYHDGLANNGGYYNTYDTNSGMYYGHRSSRGTSGSGHRSSTFAENYNKAALNGKVLHANKGNVLQTVDARALKGNLNADKSRINSTKGTATVNRPTEGKTKAENVRGTSATTTRGSSATRSVDVNKGQTRESTNIANRTNPYQRDGNKSGQAGTRSKPNVNRSRDRYKAPQVRPQSGRVSGNTYQRGSTTDRFGNRQVPSRTNGYERGNTINRNTQPRPSENIQRGTKYQDIRGARPSNDRNRGNGNYSGSNRNGQQYNRPSNRVTPKQTSPSRNNSKPSQIAPPSRNVKPSSPSRNSSPSRGSYSSPSRSGSSGRVGGGASRGGSSGSKSRGGRN